MSGMASGATQATATRVGDGACFAVCRPAWTQAGWLGAELRDDVRALLDLPLGFDLIDALRAIGPTGARCPHPHVTAWEDGDPIGVPGNPCACQVILQAAWAAVASWTTQVAADRLLDAAGAFPVKATFVPDQGRRVSITDPALDDLAASLRMAPGSLRNRLATIREQAQVPLLAEAVRDGTLAAWPAALVAQDTGHLNPEQQQLVVEVLLAELHDRHDRRLTPWTLPRVRQAVKAICARLDIDLRQARQRAKACRRVSLKTFGCSPGMAAIIADLPEDVAKRIWSRLDAITEAVTTDDAAAGDSTRTPEQVRADVFTDLLLRDPATTPNHQPGTGNGAPAEPGEVAVIVPSDVLVGGVDQPGLVPDLGPVPSEVARELAADRRWRLWLTDPRTGHVVATSPTTYRPTAALARLLRARHPYCRAPGCRRSSARSDIDHVIDFPGGSGTTPDNTGPLCRRHHNLKTHRDWTLTVEPDGTFRWTSPTGITYTDRPEPPLTDPPIDDW